MYYVGPNVLALLTTSVTIAVWVNEALVTVTVSTDDPAGVPEVVLTVKVLGPLPVTVGGSGRKTKARPRVRTRADDGEI